MTQFEQTAVSADLRYMAVFLALATLASCADESHSANPAIQWVRQFGSSKDEVAGLLAVDDTGNSYVTGFTSGSLFGPAPPVASGGHKSYVAKYDGLGNLVWGRQFGTESGRMQNRGIVVDDVGNVITAGMVDGGYDVPPIGHYYAIVAKFDAQGDLVWSTLYGSDKWDYVSDVVLDGLGGLFVAGGTEGDLAAPNAGAGDVFVSKLSESGDVAWTRQFGSAKGEAGYRIASDGAGNVFVAGPTDGNLFGSVGGIRDAFIAKLSSDGETIWSRQFGTGAADRIDGICVSESGDFYVAGTTNGSLAAMNEGGSDSFLRKYDASGNELWTRQVGSAAAELGLSVAVGSADEVYLLSTTQAKIGASQLGDYDILVTTFSASGDRLGDFQFGSTNGDIAYGIAVHDDQLLIAGTTNGAIGGLGTLSNDAFLASIKLHAAPGDFNGDGSVDAADYTIWRDHLYSSDPRGDATGWNDNQFTYVPDGTVLMADFLLWKTEFGGQSSVTESQWMVPETLGMANIGAVSSALATLCRCRRRR
ncbi:MAG: SBBP repeat-containing protein [Pirellulales bacterium]